MVKPGQLFAHYRVEELIGRGGMGEVFRAHDMKLDREVALKVLPPEFAVDADRLARFEREAKLLASLHHPNIASIFGFERAPDASCLVMELVEGTDLAALLRHGALSVDEALDVAQQIAVGLAETHERGIVHRDLKPANVRRTPGGQVKVLDFGLARGCTETPLGGEPGSQAQTVATPTTKVGTVLGTAAYMSPEQARGQEVDRRTDVWAFGCVLYEMLTGRRCFPGDSDTDVLAGVVTREPDWDLLPAKLPARIKDLLQQTLEKDPRKRLRDMGDIGLVISRSGASIPVPSRPVTSTRKRFRSFAWGAALAVLAVGGLGAITRPWVNRSEPANLLAGARFTRITDYLGSETSAAVSRDGRNIACISDRSGQWDVWVIPVGTGQPHNLTKGLVASLKSGLREVGFNHDGSEIWLTGSKNGRLRRLPLQGGTPRNWLEVGATNVSWSPDGSRIVYHTYAPGDPIMVADNDGSDGREILNSGHGYHQHFPIWGRDDWIYMVRGQENTREMDLWRIRPDGSGGEPLVTGTLNPMFPTPVDERTLVFIAQEPNGAGPWLWTFDLEQRQARRLSVGLEQYTSIDASEDGRRLVATVANPRVSLWQVPIRAGLATESDAEPLELGSVRALAPRFGPGELYYLSSWGTGDGLWRFRDGSAQEVWKGIESPLLAPVSVSADGAQLAIVLRQEGRNVLHVLSADGAELRSLSTAVYVQGSVSWSPDGAWIVTGGKDLEGNQGLFKISVEGNRVERIVDGHALNPVWSPTGELIVYAGPQAYAGQSRILGVHPDGTSAEMPLIEVFIDGEKVRFLPGGKGLIYLKSSTNFRGDFWLVDLTTMAERQLTRLEDAGTIRTFDITPDGTGVVFDRSHPNADIVMIDLERE